MKMVVIKDHPGIDYFIPHQTSYIHEYIDNCDVCLRYKARYETQVTSKYTVVLYPPDTFIVIDYTVLKPRFVQNMISKDLNILVGVEPFSRYILALPTPDQKADNVIDFIKQIKQQFPNLAFIRSDNGQHFTATAVKQTCIDLDIVLVQGRRIISKHKTQL